MKCEICHKADAETAIRQGEGEDADELYVCNACAKSERQRRQKKSQRTRKITGLPPGVSMSVTEISGSGDEPPPIIGAIMDAFNDMVSDLEKAKKAAQSSEERKYSDFPVGKCDSAYRIGDRLHLEGLHLIGELEAVKRAMHALDMELAGVSADGVNATGHVYSLRHACGAETSGRVMKALLREERNARIRLFEEMPRVFGDSLCRALAVLKNCRLLSPGECFDLLSPLRLAVYEDMLDGIGRAELEKLISDVDLSSGEDRMDEQDRDRIDAERADDMNRRFEDVVLNERSEEKFL